MPVRFPGPHTARRLFSMSSSRLSPPRLELSSLGAPLSEAGSGVRESGGHAELGSATSRRGDTKNGQLYTPGGKNSIT